MQDPLQSTPRSLASCVRHDALERAAGHIEDAVGNGDEHQSNVEARAQLDRDVHDRLGPIAICDAAEDRATATFVCYLPTRRGVRGGLLG